MPLNQPARHRIRHAALTVVLACLAAATVAAQTTSSGLNFVPAVAYGSIGDYANAVTIADLNGDGKPDIVVTNRCVSVSNCNNGSVSVLLGNGDGTFQTGVDYSTGWGTVSVTVADVNGDGRLDILVTNRCANSNCSAGGSIGVLLGNGDGTFQPMVSYNAGGIDTNAIAVGDFSGNGKMDIVVANECANTQCGRGSLGVLAGNGDGTFQLAVLYQSGGYGTDSIVVADVNGDGKPDIVTVNSCANSRCGEGPAISVLLGNGDGTFQSAVNYASKVSGPLAIADLNGDGKLDAAVSNLSGSSVSVLLGNGDGTFQKPIVYGAGGFDSTSVAIADVNGDGKPDLLVSNICASTGTCNIGGVGVLLGNGDGTFQPAMIYDAGGVNSNWVAAADVNGDGKPDIVVANDCVTNNNCNVGIVGVLINTSTTPTMTSLESSPNPSKFGQAVTFTATVTARPGFDKGVPTGTVTFSNGNAKLGSASLNTSGTAVFTISILPVGTLSMTATYNGSSSFVASTSPALKQVVEGAVIHFSASSVSFGNQTVGIASPAKPITITNKGNELLGISSIGITGTDEADFAETHNCPASLDPNLSCTVSVTFKPTTTGSRTAILSIKDNAPHSPQGIALTGVGVLPAVKLSPTSLDFSTQLIYTTSKTQTAKLINSGPGILKIEKIAATGQFTQTHNCGPTLNSGGTCTFTVTFKPTAIGNLIGSIAITDNAPGSPQSLSLKGTSTAVELTPTSINFGNQPKGTASLPKTITVTNQSHSTVSFTGISIVGTDPSDFSQTHTCGAGVASGASCFIKVVFKPTATGARTATVSVSDNGGGSPRKVSLSGSGT